MPGACIASRLRRLLRVLAQQRAAAEIGQLVVGGVVHRVGACIAPEAIEIAMFLRRRGLSPLCISISPINIF